MNEEVLTLIPKKKKGILRIFFSRVGVMVLLIIFQLLIFLTIYHWFYEYFRWFAIAQQIFSLGMIVYLFNCDMDNSGKLTWLNLILLFPVPSTIMLFLTKRDIGNRLTKQKMERLIDESRGLIEQDEDVLCKDELVDSATDDLCSYLNRSGRFPLYENTQVKYFPSGESMFDALLDELEKAQQFIFLEYFIIDEGYMWGRILKILADKAASGVDVRVMYDGMCEVSHLPHDYPKRMAKLGIKCKPFTPIMPFISTQYNYRDHRKILVIDGKVAISGGINLADEYINKKNRFGHWKDSAVMLRGESVKSFTLLFLQMWNLNEKEPEWDSFLISFQAKSDGFVMPYGDIPLDNDKVGEMVYMDILNRSKKYVYIMTPYLILDNELEVALKFAAQRGVDVKIIMPGIPDRKSAYALAKTHYKSLIDAGVKIYEYEPGFIHAKVFVSDDEKAVVGTINLDYRSLYHHYECAVYLFRVACIRDIYEDFEKTLLKCKLVPGKPISVSDYLYLAFGRLIKWLAPLM